MNIEIPTIDDLKNLKWVRQDDKEGSYFTAPILKTEEYCLELDLYKDFVKGIGIPFCLYMILSSEDGIVITHRFRSYKNKDLQEFYKYLIEKRGGLDK